MKKKYLRIINICFFLLVTIVMSSFIDFKSKIIYIQPLGDVNSKYTDYLKTSVKEFYGYECVIKPKVSLTSDILANSKTRYEASKILNKYNSNQNNLIITEKDIAHKKSDEFPEWGIFGLGLRPGKTCVISTFRLKKKVSTQKMLERLKKVALHEIGHNLGLEHCKNNKECMMNDADGTIKQVDQEKIWFCKKCWSLIR
nr:matrixin family metalloprotease [uncultured Emticicia sp.]